MKQEYSAGIIVYKGRDPEFLLLNYCAGHWDFPKGHIEKGETKEQAALRELHEETGLSVELDNSFETSLEYYFKDKDKQLVHKVVSFFLGELKSDQKVTLSFEHLDYCWLPFEQAYERLTFDNAKKVLDQANKYLK